MTTAPTRHVVAAALALLVVGTLGAVQAARAGGSFMLDLEQVQPALARIDPVIEDPQTPRLARRVFLVIVDGLRLDRSYELPFLDELRRHGVDGEAMSHFPTWSRPNYVSILTGVPPSASGVRTNHHATPVQLDALMDRARDAGLSAASGTDYDVLPRLFLRPPTGASRVGIEVDIDQHSDRDVEDPAAVGAVGAPDADLASPFDDARYAPWAGGFSEAGAALAAGKAELVVLLVGVVDAAGHQHGGDSPEYRLAAETADRALVRALGRVDLAQDAIIVVADHGHTDDGGHGGLEPEVVTVPLIAAGAGIDPEGRPRDARLIDIAPTVAALLAIPSPGHGLGRTLTEILTLDAQAATRRRSADDTRLTMTLAIVGAAEVDAAIAVLEHRALRLALVLLGAALSIAFAVVLIKRRVLRLDLRILLVTVPAFFIVYYALIGTLGQRFSPSLVPAQGHLAGTLIRFGLVATAVQLLANVWALRTQPTLGDRLAAANGVAWVGLMLAMIPAGLTWAFFPPPFVSLPDPMWMVLIPALEVGVACAAMTFALTLGVEVVVYAARAWRVRPAIE
ncbi:MAG: alkaline phosphatase family protein [Deltaproteobacteria bacterium]|nr:alkaline phosphatase family protein [Deltaproteobacteria bacterium]